MAKKKQTFLEFVKSLVATETSGEGPEWWTPLFAFTRAVKTWHKEGVQMDPAFDKADRAMRRLGGWGILELDDVQDAETAYECFAHTWARVRFDSDEGPLEQALAKAKARPLSTAREHGRKMPKYDRFVSLAGWLQVTAGDRDILLPVRQVAALLSTVQCRVSIWRGLATKDGFLTVVEPHNRGRGRATRFRFDTSRWACLMAAAASGCKAHFDFAQQHPPEVERDDSQGASP